MSCSALVIFVILSATKREVVDLAHISLLLRVLELWGKAVLQLFILRYDL